MKSDRSWPSFFYFFFITNSLKTLSLELESLFPYARARMRQVSFEFPSAEQLVSLPFNWFCVFFFCFW